MAQLAFDRIQRRPAPARQCVNPFGLAEIEGLLRHAGTRRRVVEVLADAAVERAGQAGHGFPVEAEVEVVAGVVELLLVEIAVQGHAGLAVDPLPADLLVEASEHGGARVGVRRSIRRMVGVGVVEEALAGADVPGGLPLQAGSCRNGVPVLRRGRHGSAGRPGRRKSGSRGGCGAGSSQVSFLRIIGRADSRRPARPRAQIVLEVLRKSHWGNTCVLRLLPCVLKA